MPNASDAFDPVPLIDALAAGAVDFVVIGGVAGGAHGSAFGTYDVDVAYARDRGMPRFPSASAPRRSERERLHRMFRDAPSS